MVEVFKTNVVDPTQAKMLRELIKKNFEEYEINFDLEDCDRILRVKNIVGEVQSDNVISLLKDFGFHAQILPDDYPLPVIQSLLNKSLCQ